ncbi:MAG TPA: DUF4040 domain-containing protein, partial [Alphaproteobacteria bacterium]|nr:DUF4040 domain-containing protein [Alphaproteobacteria bacterium]
YKAGLFLVVGIIDHEAGTRDITALGGLRQRLALTFAAAVLAGASMLSLPPFLGYLAKEEMYRGLAVPEWTAVAIIGALVVGNGLVGAVALAIGLKPFTGPYVEPPKNPHEAPFAMLAGPLALGGLGLFLAFTTDWLAAALLAPASSAIMGVPSHAGLHWGIDATSLVFWLSVLTWILGALAFWRFDRVRTLLRRGGAAIWSADRVFDVAMFGLIRFSAAMTRTLHHGRLELYLALVFALLAVALIVPLWSLGGLPQWPILPQLHFYEWGVMGLAVIGVVAVLLARTRLFAILALGIQGLAVSLIYLLFGAPDLSFTQFMVEVLSVIILALVMTRLHLDKRDSRELEDLLRDGSIALACGVGVTLFLFAVLEGVFEPRLSEFFNAASVELAHGRNVVNVILVDFRGLDTLGEISVIMTAGIAILALIRGARKGAA